MISSKSVVFITSAFIILNLFVLVPCSGFAGNSDSSSFKLYLQNNQVDPVTEGLSSNPFKIKDLGTAAIEGSAKTQKSGSTSLKLFLLKTAPQKYGYYIVQFSGPVQVEWKERLSALGTVFYDYIPQYGFIVRIKNSELDSIRRMTFVRWVGKYGPELKLSGSVYDISSKKLKEQNDFARLRIIAFPDADLSVLKNGVISLGGRINSSSSSKWNIKLDVKIPVQNIGGLKDIIGVKWVEKIPVYHFNNNIGTGIVGLRSGQSRDWSGPSRHLYGEDQILAICDTGLDTGDSATLHLDFSDAQGGSRLIYDELPTASCSIKDYNGHGTHVAGTAVGNGVRSGSSPAADYFPDTCFAGAAPKAKIYFQTVADKDGNLVGITGDNLGVLFQNAYDAGARVDTNSWGTQDAGDYNETCHTVDQFMWDNKDFLLLFAAGNSGWDKDLDGVVDLYSLDTPATAKNCLSVGASESYRTDPSIDSSWDQFRPYASPIGPDYLSDKPYGLAAFSSRGPTFDGRYKPEIVAPGTNILSTRSSYALADGWGAYNKYYFWSGGTSMATPLVAGTAVVMREYLMKEEGFSDPSAAMIKTSLIAGATSLVPGQYGTGTTQEIHSAPDNAQGWGRVDFDSSINSDSRYKIKYYDVSSDAPINNSYSRTFTFDVESNQKPFRATLGWTDFPGSTIACGGLVNDLDLRVKKPDGGWVYPDKAMNLSRIIKKAHVSSVETVYAGEKVAAIFDPSTFGDSSFTYPANLESVYLVFKNDVNVISPVSIVIYRYSAGAVKEELFRKNFAFIPTGCFALPIGLTLTEGSIVVSVEKMNTSIGCLTQNEATGKGLIYDGGSWKSADFTPAIGVLFRTKVPSSNFDRVNNTVSVTIAKPEPGTYTAEVTAHNVPEGPQPYALVLSGMVDAAPTTGNIEFDPGQPDAPAATFLAKEHYSKTAENVNSLYNTSFSEVYSDESSFEVQTVPQGTVSIRYAVTGFSKITPQMLRLAKLYSNGTSRFFSYANYEDYTDGKWWLTDVSGQYISPVTMLNSNSTYYAVSTIRDGGSYDSNPQEGLIDDPQILGLDEGESSGCNIGLNNDYGIALLLIIAVFSILLRCLAARKKVFDRL